MSAHFEHLDTTIVDLVSPGEKLGEQLVDQYALVIGDPWDIAAVIEGTLEHIESRLESFLSIVHSAKDRQQLGSAGSTPGSHSGACRNTTSARPSPR